MGLSPPLPPRPRPNQFKEKCGDRITTQAVRPASPPSPTHLPWLLQAHPAWAPWGALFSLHWQCGSLGPSCLIVYLVFFLSPCGFCSFPQLRMKRFRQFQSRSWEKLSVPLRISRLPVMTGCVHTKNSLGTSKASFSSLFLAGGLCFSAPRTSSHQFILCWLQFCQVPGILQPEQWPQADLVQSSHKQGRKQSSGAGARP